MHRRPFALALAALSIACGRSAATEPVAAPGVEAAALPLAPASPPPSPVTSAPGADPCAEAQARLGQLVCVTSVPDRATWERLHIGSAVHWTRFLVPSSPAARVPALLGNGNVYELHVDLMAKGLATRFPGLDETGYARLVLNPARREFYGGSVVEHRREGWFGFTVEEVASGPVDAHDVDIVRQALAALVTFAPLTFEPTPEQAARGLGVVRTDGDPDYEAYSRATAFGRVRRVDPDHLPDDLGPSDVVLLGAAPYDLSAPVAAIVTGTRTAELSHLNVRSAARGTPSCFVKDADARLTPWEGRVVRITCGEAGLEVAAATDVELARWLTARRPAPVGIARPASGGGIVGLLELPTQSVEDRATGLSRYGSKGRNYAVLAQRVSVDWTYDGLLVPFAPYLAFMAEDRPAGSFAKRAVTASALVGAPRTAALQLLRDDIERASPDPAFVAELSRRVAQTLGPTTMVRFRSSSNAEDDLRFSAAGLYTSTSVCIADDRDGDDVGPSACDAGTDRERGVARGLTRVWASLWADRAVAEREWYGIPADAVAMGILVDPRAADERANIVAFTGLPNGRPGDPRAVLVEAQAGEAEVVSTDPGVWPEQVVLPATGGVQRISRSSLAAEVLSDAQLKTLADRLATIEAVYPVDDPAPAGHDVVLDTEWKVLADGRLVVKQVRPFLR